MCELSTPREERNERNDSRADSPENEAVLRSRREPGTALRIAAQASRTVSLIRGVGARERKVTVASGRDFAGAGRGPALSPAGRYAKHGGSKRRSDSVQNSSASGA